MCVCNALTAAELGHWSLNHTVHHLALMQVNLLAVFYMFGALMYDPVRRAATITSIHMRPGCLCGVWTAGGRAADAGGADCHHCLCVCAIPRGGADASDVHQPPVCQHARHLQLSLHSFEFAADRFAAALGHGLALQRALVKLTNVWCAGGCTLHCHAQDNLSFPIYDALYSAVHHTHPTLLQRLDALQALDKREQ